MEKKELRILVVDDDPTMGKALTTAIEKHGYSATLATTPDQARSAIKLHDYRVLLIDCMLPKTDGITLMKELKERIPSDILAILMSGVFRDKHYINEALTQTGVTTFLNKPFDIPVLLKLIDDNFQGEVSVSIPPLYSLFREDRIVLNQIKTALNDNPDLHGFDIAWTLKCLSAAQATGYLTVEIPGDSSARIGIRDGLISRVESDDKESYFGVILIEKGFTSASDVESALSSPSQKRIGESLVDVNALSPHAIRIAQVEQMMVRLSKIIKKKNVSLRFAEEEMPGGDYELNKIQLTTLLNDWVVTKMDSNWLSAFFNYWADYPLIGGPELPDLPVVLSLSACRRAGIGPDIASRTSSIQELFDSQSSPTGSFMQGLYLLVLLRALRFGEPKSKSSSYDRQLRRLKEQYANLDEMNHFEALGLANNARTSEIRKAYQELSRALHPDKLPPQAPPELRQLRSRIFSRITQAHNILSDEAERAKYLRTLEYGEIEDALKIESLFERGRKELSNGRYQKAKELFEEISNINHRRTDIPLFKIWCDFKMSQSSKESSQIRKEAQEILERVPPEDRHNPPYLVVRGLIYKTIGEYQKAANCFKSATAKDPTFLDAKRELVALKSHIKAIREREEQNDFSVVVSQFFKGKK